MVASIAVLAFIGFAINEDNLPINMEQITVVKGSTGLYEKLMEKPEVTNLQLYKNVLFYI